MKTASSTYLKLLPLSVGFALFAMFFGAGNLVFPLAIGTHAGHDVIAAILGFLLAGVVVPFLGLYVISLYHGNYMEFLANLGKIPAFIVALLLVFLMGLFIGVPRTSLLSFNTLVAFFPLLTPHRMLFNAIFFILVYLVSLQQMRIVDALGLFLSPVKLLALFTLIVFGLGIRHQVAPPGGAITNLQVFSHAVKLGYGTMDLLAGFFFCAFVHKTICHKLDKSLPQLVEGLENRITLIACIIGAVLLGTIYSFFILVANFHALPLQGVPTQALIGQLALLLLHKYGGIFVSICVTLACFSTAVAVNAITVDFIHIRIFRKHLSYHLVLPLVVLVVFLVSNLGFTLIMKIAIPILTVLYPALLALTLGNIVYKIKCWNIGPWLFYIVLFIAIFTIWQVT